VEVVTGRLGAVGGPVARVLERIALGEPLPAPILEQLCGAKAVAVAEQRGLVVVEQSGQRTVARLAHPLYGEVIRSTMPWATARSRAGELAVAVAATPMRRRDDALRVGVWQLQAGRPGDATILLAATRQALCSFDVTLAARLARAARDSGGGWPAEYRLAQILANCGWYEQAARALPDKPDGPGARTCWAIVRADTDYWGLGRPDEADRALAEAGSAPGRRAAEAYRGLISMFDSRCADALRIGAEILDRGDAEPQAVLWAAVGASASAGIVGDHKHARSHYERGLAVSATHPDALPWGRVQAGSGYCMALLAAGRVDEAWTISGQEYQAAVRAERPGTARRLGRLPRRGSQGPRRPGHRHPTASPVADPAGPVRHVPVGGTLPGGAGRYIRTGRRRRPSRPADGPRRPRPSPDQPRRPALDRT
jgi:hypothetical protein